MHASSDSPCHSSAKPLPLEGLSPSHRAFQEHATHTIEWSIMLSSKGSLGTCIPKGVSTFFHTAFTAHSEARAEAVGVGSSALLGASAAAPPHMWKELSKRCVSPKCLSRLHLPHFRGPLSTSSSLGGAAWVSRDALAHRPHGSGHLTHRKNLLRPRL